ncbi:hypothetical protein D5F01_LYC22450 [Larimichthys crocea]|uniref:Uncharacterized protein n=1 Tax=Larimichthys crocea TaxID=215358 RepID=A0A6G0HIL6_LARCR|nr:hypothetical protein D5F01_LYC22450 [Larimichthys crocea]
MKEAEKIEEKSNNIAQRIQKLFDQLKAEIKKVSPSADLDEVDRSVMTKLLGAMARRSALEMKIDFSKLHDMLHRSPHKGMNMQLNPSSLNTMTIVLAGILTFFTFQNSGKGFKLLIAEATKRLIKQMSTTGVKTAFKGGAMVVGGAVGLAFAFPEAVDNWKEAIKNNHVTKASQSLKDTADAILKMTRELREQFDNMRKMLVDVAEQQEQERIEMARRQREQERIEMVRRQREQERIEMARHQQEQERIEMARRQREQERIEMARRQREQERIEMARRQREQERIEMARRQQEQERIEMARRQQEQERIEMARRQQEQERIEMARRQQEQERIEMARRQQEQERIEMARRQKNKRELRRLSIKKNKREPRKLNVKRTRTAK